MWHLDFSFGVVEFPIHSPIIFSSLLFSSLCFRFIGDLYALCQLCHIWSTLRYYFFLLVYLFSCFPADYYYFICSSVEFSAIRIACNDNNNENSLKLVSKFVSLSIENLCSLFKGSFTVYMQKKVKMSDYWIASNLYQ